MTDVQYVACIFHVVFLFIDDGCILHVYQMQLVADYKSVFPMLVSPNLYGDFFFGSEIVFYIAGRGHFSLCLWFSHFYVHMIHVRKYFCVGMCVCVCVCVCVCTYTYIHAGSLLTHSHTHTHTHKHT